LYNSLEGFFLLALILSIWLASKLLELCLKVYYREQRLTLERLLLLLCYYLYLDTRVYAAVFLRRRKL
jgi:hypothetical protein